VSCGLRPLIRARTSTARGEPFYALPDYWRRRCCFPGWDRAGASNSRISSRLLHLHQPSGSKTSLKKPACILWLRTVHPGETPARNHARRVALFDYDGDGLLDIYLVNGAEMPSLVKTSPKYYNRLFHNNVMERSPMFQNAPELPARVLAWARRWATTTMMATPICFWPRERESAFFTTMATVRSPTSPRRRA